MKTVCSSLLLLSVFAFAAPVQAEAAETRQALMPQEHRALFKQYCFECHNAEDKDGGVDLESIPFDIAKDNATAGQWQRILDAMNAKEMPPAYAEQVSDREKTVFLDALSNQMVAARGILTDSGGVVHMRRLNRREYGNTVETLIGVRPDTSSLPDDRSSEGFDTSGASLFLSSDQIEQYIDVAQAALKRSLEFAATAGKPLKAEVVRVQPEDGAAKKYKEQLEHNRDVVKRARAFQSQKNKPARDYGFQDAPEAKRQLSRAKNYLPQLEAYFKRPEHKQGAILIQTIKNGATRIRLPDLYGSQSGRYVIRVRAGAYPAADDRMHYLEFVAKERFGATTRLGWRKVTGTVRRPDIVEFAFTHPVGKRMEYWIHQRTHQGRGDKNLWDLDYRENGTGTAPGLWVDWAERKGPFVDNTGKAAAVKLFARKPKGWSDDQFAKTSIQRFAMTAFRNQKPSADYLSKLLDIYRAARADGKNLHEALIEPYAIVLASPSFVYMVEEGGDRVGDKLSPMELAVRLSYFLWSEAPDPMMVSAARSGSLPKLGILKEHAERLLADDKADRFIEGFFHQWFEMHRLDMFEFKATLYRDFDNATKGSARQEIYETVRTVIDDNLSIKSLLDGKFVVVNDVMADYYGLGKRIPPKDGHEFRKITFTRSTKRGGLLGTAAVLAMGSDGVRSSPVERGAWVLRHLLNDPPPPAPPNVPQLNRLEGEPLGARDLQKLHMEEPQCAQCHLKIDPIGYAMENFDAAGKWREMERIRVDWRKNRFEEFPIDPRGTLPDGTRFNNFAGLKRAVSGNFDEFTRGFTEALIAYGMGRPYGFSDEPLADEIIAYAKKNNYKISAFIVALVQSETFRSR